MIEIFNYSIVGIGLVCLVIVAVDWAEYVGLVARVDTLVRRLLGR